MLLPLLQDWLWLQRSQWFDSDTLVRLQNKMLKEIVTHAFRTVPFYQRLYSSSPLELGNIDIGNLNRLPIITKQQFRDVPLSERTSAEIDPRTCFTRTTSGSTGIPLTVLEEPRSAVRRAALWLRRFRTYGVRLRDSACYVTPDRLGHTPLHTSAKGALGFLMRRKIRPLWLDEDIHDQIRFISEKKPAVLVGPASYYRALIRSCQGSGASLSVRVAIANGETLDGATRRLIRDELHTDNVFEVFGAAEVGSIGWECPTHSGFHINADSIVHEVLRDGEPVGPGESGELVVTNLYRRATPAIRYLVGDIFTLSEGGCSCGRGLPLVSAKQGRFVDYISAKDRPPVSPFTVMRMFEDLPGIAQYKVHQREDYSIDVLVEAFRNPNEPLLESLQERLARLFGATPFSIQLVDKIDYPKGHKFRAVQSEVKQTPEPF